MHRYASADHRTLRIVSTVLGRRTGVIADFPLGEVLPARPRGWFWSLVTVEEPLEIGTIRRNYVSDET